MSPSTIATVEAEVRAFIQDRDAAVAGRDIAHILSFYDNDVRYFDCIPPFQARGVEALRQGWEMCFSCVPEAFGLVSEGLQVYGDGDTAAAYWFWRFTGLPQDHPAMQSYIRATAILTRVDGRWRIVHEHGSLPHDPMTQQAVNSLVPMD